MSEGCRAHIFYTVKLDSNNIYISNKKIKLQSYVFLLFVKKFFLLVHSAMVLVCQHHTFFFFFFLLTTLLFYWNILSFTVNLRSEITKADSHAARVWLFYKRLVLHLVKGLMKERQNNTTKPNDGWTQTNMFSEGDGESSELFTWSHMYALSSRVFGKQTVNQPRPACPWKERVPCTLRRLLCVKAC